MCNKLRVLLVGSSFVLILAYVSAGGDSFINAQQNNVANERIKGGVGTFSDNSAANTRKRKTAPRRTPAQAAPATKPSRGRAGAPGVARLDTLAIPAGVMSGGGDPAKFIGVAGSAACHTGADCTRFTYKAGGQWGGLFWWPALCGATGTPAAWAKVKEDGCAINVLQAGGLSAVGKVSFWAKGQHGGEVVEFKVGALDILPRPGKSLGKVTLTPEWVRYEIDLKGVNLTRMIGLFAWVADDVSNPQGLIFYLDDVQFEGAA